MENVTLFLVGLAVGVVLVEGVAGIILYRNRTVLLARLKAVLGLPKYLDEDLLNLRMSIDSLRDSNDRLEASATTIERKINYIGKHVKFEKEQLAKLGIKKAPSTKQVTTTTEENVVKFPKQ